MLSSWCSRWRASAPSRTINSNVGPAFLDLTVPVEFRIFGYLAQNDPSGTWRLGVSASDVGGGVTGLPRNLQLSGDLTTVPQPSTLVLLGATLTVLSVAWLRRRLS